VCQLAAGRKLESKNLPTLVAYDAEGDHRANHYHGLGWMARNQWAAETPAPLLPTLTVDDAHNVTRASGQFSSLTREVTTAAASGGRLNPDWCEWLMGFPIGWSASQPLETPRCREWSRSHGMFSPGLPPRIRATDGKEGTDNG
jgi:hypothetical protein